MRQRFYLPLVAAFTLVGCAGQIPSDDDDDDDDDDMVVCAATRSYTGFGNRQLEASRAAIEAGSDRLRVKPFTALSAEYQAALGLTAFDTSAYASTFGRPPARWYIEPAASANTVYAAFALAYDACTQHTAADPQYAAVPEPQLADLICREHARRAWHREATDDEAATCATYAVNQTDSADPPRKRWAYACAAVISASGFLAY
ncbi:MAG TPA: hypothetical protein VIV11_11995 [Kofleriaceae bacterium]